MAELIGRAADAADACRRRPVTVLAPLLDHLAESEDAIALARDGGDAFCSSALRPFLIAALLAPRRRAPDDRGRPRRSRRRRARRPTCALAGAAPRVASTRRAASPTSPTSRRRRTSSGCASRRSTRSPPGTARRCSSSRRRRCRRRSPTRRCARTRSRSRSASCSTSTSARRRSSRWATSASRRSRTAASSRCAAVCSTSSRRPPSAPCASSCSTSRSSRCARSRRSRSARSRRSSRSRWRRAAELALEHRGVALEGERPDIAELLPLDRFVPLLDLVGRRARDGRRRRRGDRADAARPLGRRLRRVPRRATPTTSTWPRSDARGGSCGARTDPPALARGQRRRSSSTPRRPAALARSLGEAEAELERDLRSGYRTVVTWARRGDGERAAHNLARLQRELARGFTAAQDRLTFAQANLREGFVAAGLRLAVIPDHLLFHRRRATVVASRGRAPRRAALLRRPARRRHRRPRGPRHRALRRLRDAHGRRGHARLPLPRVPGRRPRLRADRPVREDLALRRCRRRAPDALAPRRQPLGHAEGARPPRRAGAGRGAALALRRTPPPRGPRLRRRRRLAARVRAALPLHRDARPARGDRGRSRPTWRRRGRWTA